MSAEGMENLGLLKALETRNFSVLSAIGKDFLKSPTKKERKTLIGQFNATITSFSIAHNDPESLQFMIFQSNDDIFVALNRISKLYISSKDPRWYGATLELSNRLVRKSHQAAFFAQFACDLIDAGVKTSDADQIEAGIQILGKVGFRKYRSKIITEIFPLLIAWGVQKNDAKILSTYAHFLDDVGDVSKRSLLHCKLAMAITLIGEETGELSIIIGGIKDAVSIQQKTKRQTCIRTMFDKLMQSPVSRYFVDIPKIMEHFSDFPESGRQEIIHALIVHLLENEYNSQNVKGLIWNLKERLPSAIPCLILTLLEKAEHSGDRWCYEEAFRLAQVWHPTDLFALKHYVRAAVTIAELHGVPEIIESLVPFVDQSKYRSRIFLQFSKTLLRLGDFRSALEMFSRISLQSDFTPQMTECTVQIVKYAILHDEIDRIREGILTPLNTHVRDSVIRRAVIELCKGSPFEIGSTHGDSLRNVASMHSVQGALLLEAITILIDLGFLDHYDPAVLIRITEGLQNQSERERAISNIIIKIAETGIERRNRDYLQHAVGLSCLIEDKAIRSQALSTIIDDAAHLAADQGDLNLLQRMKEWSVSLLEKNSADFAITNIIEGMIRYGLAFRSALALEEAYTASREIHDNALQMHQIEHIAEYFVRLGCVRLSESEPNQEYDTIEDAIRPFIRSLEILSKVLKDQNLILKISGFIDITLDHATQKGQLSYTIPLSLLILAIENPLERDAMIRRINSVITDMNEVPDSSDPYQTMVHLLQRDVFLRSTPLVMDLSCKLAELVADPYSRLSELITLADEYHTAGSQQTAMSLLSEVLAVADTVPLAYQKALIQTYVTKICTRFDLELAEKSLERAIMSFSQIKGERKSLVAEQIVQVLANLDARMIGSGHVTRALVIASEIPEPLSQAWALLAVAGMSDLDRSEQKRIFTRIENIAPEIQSPYERACVLLDLFSAVIRIRDGDRSRKVLDEILSITKSIRVRFVSGLILKRTAKVLLRVSELQSDPSLREIALQMASEADNILVRPGILLGDTTKDLSDGNVPYPKIRAVAQKIAQANPSSHQVSSLDQLVQQIQDRGERASYYSELALLFQKEGHMSVYEKLLRSAVTEAAIVRPLSRRAYIFCDISLKLFEAGDEMKGREFFDQAIEAATNIRQYTLRDEVFEDLGMAMSVLQEIAP